MAQTLNWSALNPAQKNLFNIETGIQYGVTGGFGYGYQLRSAKPIILYTKYSMPVGKNLFDDFKTRMGGHIKIYQIRNFIFSGKFYSVVRKYENNFARLLNFGSELSIITGYYRAKWFIAGEAGFDKAILTHFKHSKSYKALYPDVKDGWYEPASGGNLFYGLLGGVSIKNADIYLNVGKIISQDLQTKPVLPVNIQLGLNLKFQG